jgi:hypothetical protein
MAQVDKEFHLSTYIPSIPQWFERTICIITRIIDKHDNGSSNLTTEDENHHQVQSKQSTEPDLNKQHDLRI